MPRSNTRIKQRAEEMEKDYTEYAIKSLPLEYEYMSKLGVARNALWEFGHEKWGHESAKYISDRFISPAFNEHGESTGKRSWVYYRTYELLSPGAVEDWRTILKEEHITKEKVWECYLEGWEGEEEREVDWRPLNKRYKQARQRFVAIYGDFPILLTQWRTNDRTETRGND